MKRIYLIIFLFLSSLLPAWAQYVEPGVPYSQEEASDSRALTFLDTLRIAPPSASEISKLIREGNAPGVRALRFAKAIPVNFSPASSGSWSEVGEGRRSWRLHLRVEGASSLGIRFDHYHLPQGAKLYIHGSNGVVRGAYTEQNNSEGKGLNLAYLRGDFLSLELNLPRGVNPSEVKLHISEIQYGYQNVWSESRTRASDVFNKQGEPFYNVYGTGLDRLSCAPNVVAYPEYNKQARSVLLMVMEGALMGSGVLINNTRQDGTAYVLTAAHNLNKIYDEDIDSWEKVQKICNTIVFFFGFDSPSADQNIRGVEELTLSGAELIAYNTDADMALLKITGLPRRENGTTYIPDYYNPYFSGWNISLQPSGSFYGIHHALASTKRISFVEDRNLSLKDYSVKEQYWTQKHWDIKSWAIGTTEAGASGSPLFDGQGLIIGALSGGRSTCNSPKNDSYYAIAQTWFNGQTRTSLKPWLDPIGTGQMSLDGYDPQRVALSRLSDYYGTNTSNYKWASFQAREGISGVGRRVYLNGGVKPLGVFVHLGENGDIRQANPRVNIELRKLQDGIVQEEVVWHTELNTYNYRNYNKNQGFGYARRSLGYDEVALFLPAKDVPLLDRGDYLLSVRTSDNSTLNYPILTDTKRMTDPKLKRNLWELTSSGTWNLSSTSQNLWIDVLLEGQAGVDASESFYAYPRESAYTSYYHDGIIYVHNSGNKADVFVYSLEGFLLHKEEISHGETQINISSLPTGHVYVVFVKGDKGKHSYKIIR